MGILKSKNKKQEEEEELKRKYAQCVVHHAEEINSCAIKVCGDQNVWREEHIIVKKDGIDDNFVINAQARKGIQTFLDENPSDEIDVIRQIQDDSTTMYGYLKSYLESYLSGKMEDVKVNFLQAETPTHPWIFVCDTFNKDKFLKLKETSKDHGSMLLIVHGYQTIHREASVLYIDTGDDKQTIHLFLGNSEIDDSLYINKSAKDELRRKIESNIAGDDANKGKLESKSVSSQHWKQIYIKCLANPSRKTFTNFTERYITRMKPIWKTREDLIEEGSLCIVVCFNLSRLQDTIEAVLRDTPHGCKNMLVVIQNCQEGISPGPMLRNNPSNNFIDFTNILSEDGKCYDCQINSMAVEQVQAFIDNN